MSGVAAEIAGELSCCVGESDRVCMNVCMYVCMYV